MKSCIEIGASPSAEECAQIGDEDYKVQAKKECTTLIRQLRRVFGQEPEAASLKIKWSPHDFGSYAEVACYFDSDDEESAAYAARCEAECPESWDEEALKELE